jgi:hypothetical protein
MICTVFEAARKIGTPVLPSTQTLSGRPGMSRCPKGSSDLPSGNFRISEFVKPCMEKYSGFQKVQISLYPQLSRPRQKGRFAIVTDVGGGMRWTRLRL